MKKLISIGVALALLTMAVVPGAVAAQIEPETYSKIPFAIIGSGLELFADVWTELDTALGMDMPWISTVLDYMAPWTAGPLAWSVDMLSWGVSLLGSVLADAQALIVGMGVSLPIDLADVAALCDTIACGLLTAWAPAAGGNFTPCG